MTRRRTTYKKLPVTKPLVITAHEAAAILGVSESTISRMCDDGRLPKAPLGVRRTLIPLAAIEQLVAEAVDEAAAKRARLADITTT